MGIRIFHFFVIHNIIVSGEAILSAENRGKPLDIRAPPRTALEKLTALPRSS